MIGGVKKLDDPFDPIEEQFSSGDEISKDLFNEGDITLKSDLNDKEVILVTQLFIENKLIKDILDFDLYGEFIHEFKRHKVSRNRGSRLEFVDVNRRDNFDNNLNKFANLKSLTEVKQ